MTADCEPQPPQDPPSTDAQSPSSGLVFLMGKFAAHIPLDRRYFAVHAWIKPLPETTLSRVGLTSYAVRLLQDVYFLDWTIDPDTPVVHKQEIGQIETSKALSSLYAPAVGRIVRFNPALMNDPSLINRAHDDEGWLYEFETTAATLSPTEYLAHLEANWDATQRMLKSQYND